MQHCNLSHKILVYLKSADSRTAHEKPSQPRFGCSHEPINAAVDFVSELLEKKMWLSVVWFCCVCIPGFHIRRGVS